MSSLPLRYWCRSCGTLLFKSDRDASGLIEAVCKNRRCHDRGPRVLRLPEDALEVPHFNGRMLRGTFAAQSA